MRYQKGMVAEARVEDVGGASVLAESVVDCDTGRRRSAGDTVAAPAGVSSAVSRGGSLILRMSGLCARFRSMVCISSRSEHSRFRGLNTDAAHREEMTEICDSSHSFSLQMLALVCQIGILPHL